MQRHARREHGLSLRLSCFSLNRYAQAVFGQGRRVYEVRDPGAFISDSVAAADLYQDFTEFQHVRPSAVPSNPGPTGTPRGCLIWGIPRACQVDCALGVDRDRVVHSQIKGDERNCDQRGNEAQRIVVS
jgi:hypothetical protein